LIADGLTEIEISELETQQSKVSNLCKELAKYSIKQTIVQPDFNDNNTLINDVSQAITSIDLGEIVISHPFFSLLNYLFQIKKHHRLTEADDEYIQIKNACLARYMNFESKENLLDAFSTAQKLWVVYWILAQHRLILACDNEKIMSFKHGKLSSSFRELMAT